MLGSARPLKTTKAFAFKGPKGKLCALVPVIVEAPSDDSCSLSQWGPVLLITGDAFLVLHWKNSDENSLERFLFRSATVTRDGMLKI